MKKYIILFLIFLFFSGCLNSKSSIVGEEFPNVKNGIVVFSAEWCHYCKALKPYLEELKAKGYNVIIIDVDKNRDLAEKYNIRGVPTIFYIKDGKVIDYTIGYNPDELMEKAKLVK
ncbi:thioredoxin family protein [Methanocaldococcus sp.]